MRVVHHDEPGLHKLLHIETEGCVVNVTIGLHDMSGRRFTSVEVVSEEPDGDGAVWTVQGSGTVIVRREGHQVLAGDAHGLLDAARPRPSRVIATGRPPGHG